MTLVRALFAFGILMGASVASAYPNYISYGYQSCLNCHYNPMGGGPLTDYGRSVAATELTARELWPASIRGDDEKLADRSGFLFDKPKNNWLRPSASYRGLFYEVSPGKSTQQSKWVNMDASAALVAKFMSNDRLTFVGQLSYAPTPMEEQGSDKKYENYRSREANFGYRFSKSFGVYAGLMDKAFGLRVPDHIAFSRTATGLTENDQTEGVLFHLLAGRWEVALQPFIGNLVQESNLRQKGATLQFGRMIGESSRIGVSAASSSSNELAVTMYSIDARAGFDKGNSLLFEVGQVDDKAKSSATKTSSRYVFLQNQWLLRQGLYSVLTAEAQQPDIKQNSQTYRFGPGLQYFPIYRVELRADVYDTRIRNSAAYSDDQWMITGQVHLWF